jgi:hypothetical protein
MICINGYKDEKNISMNGKSIAEYGKIEQKKTAVSIPPFLFQ